MTFCGERRKASPGNPRPVPENIAVGAALFALPRVTRTVERNRWAARGKGVLGDPELRVIRRPLAVRRLQRKQLPPRLLDVGVELRAELLRVVGDAKALVILAGRATTALRAAARPPARLPARRPPTAMPAARVPPTRRRPWPFPWRRMHNRNARGGRVLRPTGARERRPSGRARAASGTRTAPCGQAWRERRPSDVRGGLDLTGRAMEMHKGPELEQTLP